MRKNRQKQEINRGKKAKKGKSNKQAANTSANSQVENIIESTQVEDSGDDSEYDSGADSDCEVVEQPSDLIVLDEDSNASESTESSESISPEDPNSSGSGSAVEAESTSVDRDSPCPFYEDKEPSINFAVPLYESVNCILVDSTTSACDESVVSTSETMPVIVQTNKRTDSVKDRLGFRSRQFVAHPAIVSTEPNKISSDTPNVPKKNLRVSVQPTENEMTTRTCTITSSSAASSDSVDKTPTAINESTMTKANAVYTESQPQTKPQSKRLKITFTNKEAPSTSAVVDDTSKTSDANLSFVVQNNEKRRRKDSDIIFIDETTSESHRDDSVIFVSESINTGRPIVPLAGKRKGGPLISFGSDYVPIAGKTQDGPPSKKAKTKSTRAQRKMDKKAAQRSLIELSRGRQSSFNAVARSTQPNEKNNNGEKQSNRDTNKMEKRMIIIDGSNVAFG